MATVGEPQRKILVIDAGGIIEAKENNLHRLASEFYTTSSVVQELKDTRSRAFFDTFPLPIHIKGFSLKSWQKKKIVLISLKSQKNHLQMEDFSQKHMQH